MSTAKGPQTEVKDGVKPVSVVEALQHVEGLTKGIGDQKLAKVADPDKGAVKFTAGKPSRNGSTVSLPTTWSLPGAQRGESTNVGMTISGGEGKPTTLRLQNGKDFDTFAFSRDAGGKPVATKVPTLSELTQGGGKPETLGDRLQGIADKVPVALYSKPDPAVKTTVVKTIDVPDSGIPAGGTGKGQTRSEAGASTAIADTVAGKQAEQRRVRQVLGGMKPGGGI